MPVLRTARFLLRDLRESDVGPRYRSWFHDDTVSQFIVSSSEMKDEARLREYVRERSGRSDVLFLGIFAKPNALHIGNIKFEPVDADCGFAVMGLMVGDPEWRGRGVAGEVLSETGRWLRNNRAIREIVLGVEENNLPAIRAYQKIGFERQETPHVVAKDGCLTMVWRL